METVTIDKAEYESLKRDAAWLESLNAAGIDNTDAYSFAFDIFEENYPEYAEEW